MFEKIDFTIKYLFFILAFIDGILEAEMFLALLTELVEAF